MIPPDIISPTLVRPEWPWVTFSKPNPTQNIWTQPNAQVFIRPNPTHHRNLVWHIRLYRKLYTTTVTLYSACWLYILQANCQRKLLFSCSTH